MAVPKARESDWGWERQQKECTPHRGTARGLVRSPQLAISHLRSAHGERQAAGDCHRNAERDAAVHAACQTTGACQYLSVREEKRQDTTIKQAQG